MEIEEKSEEILETLWIQTQEKKEDFVPLKDVGGMEAKNPIEKLLQAGYVLFTDNEIRLTSKGRLEAANVARRHRLAERLLTDVLDTKGTLVHERACKFEHLLDRGLDESICTLLGHPRICPHGRSIPPGRCCQNRESHTQKLISPLVELSPGQKGKIAYIYAPESDKLQKLTNMGVLPGATLSLIQSFPSYVFQVGKTQFAVDREIANAIYVRLIGGEVSAGSFQERQQHRQHKWKHWFIRRNKNSH